MKRKICLKLCIHPLYSILTDAINIIEQNKFKLGEPANLIHWNFIFSRYFPFGLFFLFWNFLFNELYFTVWTFGINRKVLHEQPLKTNFEINVSEKEKNIRTSLRKINIFFIHCQVLNIKVHCKSHNCRNSLNSPSKFVACERNFKSEVRWRVPTLVISPKFRNVPLRQTIKAINTEAFIA